MPALCVTNHYLAIVYYTPHSKLRTSKGLISQFYYSNKFHFLSFIHIFAIESMIIIDYECEMPLKFFRQGINMQKRDDNKKKDD